MPYEPVRPIRGRAGRPGHAGKRKLKKYNMNRYLLVSLLLMLCAHMVLGQRNTVMNTETANPGQDLKEAYIDIVGRVCSDTALIHDQWDEVEQAYTGERRYYHNLVHLRHFYGQLLSCRGELRDFETAFLAMIYHDVVYFSPEGRNEEESAEFAERHLAELGFAPDIIARCKALILATKTHAESEDTDTNYFIDADMSILGEEEARYHWYAENIRKEYGDTPQFDRGRARALAYFLEMERIYKTDWFHSRYEEPARANIQWELESLTNK